MNAFEIIFDELMKPEVSEVWFSILHSYIIRYPESVTSDILQYVLSSLLNLNLTQPKQRLARIQCYAILLDIDNQSRANSSQLTKLWGNVWDNTIR